MSIKPHPMLHADDYNDNVHLVLQWLIKSPRIEEVASRIEDNLWHLEHYIRKARQFQDITIQTYTRSTMAMATSYDYYMRR